MIRQILGYAFLLVATVIPVSPQDASSQLPSHSSRCDTVKKVLCIEGKCEDVPPLVYFLLGRFEGNPSYSRCDRNGCDTYPAIVKASGIYENWQTMEPKGVIFKRVIEGKQDFVEVATIGLQAYVSTGVCKAVATQ